MVGILFDLNNCLVHRQDIPFAVGNAVKKAVSEAGYEYTVPDKFLTDSYLTEHGRNHKLLFLKLLHHCKVETRFREEVLTRCLELYTQYKDYSLVTPYPDTEYLFELEVPTGIITNSSQETTDQILERTGLNFEHHFTGGEKEKLIKQAKEKMGEIVFVGDSTSDICLGKQNDLYTIALNRGIIPVGKLLRARPNLILNSLAPLPYFIENYNSDNSNSDNDPEPEN